MIDSDNKYKASYIREKETKNKVKFHVSPEEPNPVVLDFYVDKKYAGKLKMIKLRLIPIKKK